MASHSAVGGSIRQDPPYAPFRRDPPYASSQIAAVLLAALIVRLTFFTGLSLGDDVFYTLQSLAQAAGGSWPPPPYHWYVRTGVTGPTAVSLLAFGWQPWAFVLVPFAASLLGVLACYLFARAFVSHQAAVLAAAFQAAFPLEVIYSTHLFPDVIVGMLSAVSLASWILALRTDGRGFYILAGASFALGYLCRETVVMSGPVYIALWALAGRWWRPGILWTALVPVLVVGGEMTLFWATTGNPAYRLDAMASQQRDPETLAVIARSEAGGGFWTDPLLLLLTSQEFAAYHLAVLACLPFLWRRRPELRPLAVWWAVGYVWFFYGTTAPLRYVPLHRDPRYLAFITMPAAIMLAAVLWQAKAAVRWGAAAVLIATGIGAAAMDSGRAPLAAHQRFLQSPYAGSAALEPFEYLGARWTLGLETPPAFRVVEDEGRDTVVRLLGTLPGTVRVRRDDAPYVVLAPLRRSGLEDRFRNMGWRVVAEFPPDVPAARRLVAGVLGRFEAQRARAARIGHPRGLVVFENPGVR